jgi:hypothetical protein|nr:MAG TPA: hypothetical protein [Caudoviricetes sp.]
MACVSFLCRNDYSILLCGIVKTLIISGIKFAYTINYACKNLRI